MPKNVKGILFSWGFILSLLISGCGYTTRSLIADKFRTIHVEQFVNKIDLSDESDAGNKYKINKPGAETDITRAVINKFLFDGNLKPVGKEGANLLLKGELAEFRRDPLRYTNEDDVEEYRVNVVVNLSLYDQRENKLLWTQNNFTGDTTYFTRGSAAKSDDVAANDAITDLARRIVERTVEEW